MRDAQERLRTSARTENPLKTRRAVDVARQMIPSGIRVEEGPSSSAMSRSYRNYKSSVILANNKNKIYKYFKARKEIGDDMLDSPNIQIPPQLREKVIFFDMVESGETMLVFCSAFGRRILEEYGNNICIDGTFKVN